MDKYVRKSGEQGISLLQRQKNLSWFSALKQSIKATLRIDRTQLTALQAVRATIGFAIPLALGVATGHVIEGVSIAAGASLIASVGLTYTNRVRVRTMLLACLGLAISAFVGSLTGRIDILAILAISIWGFGAGMLVAFGQPAVVIGLQSVLAMIVLAHYGLPLLEGALQALLILVGALIQVLLVLLFTPWQRTTTERITLVRVYQRLAENATDYQYSQESESSIRSVLQQAQNVLSGNKDQSARGHIFQELYEEAEHIRLIFIVLRTLYQQISGTQREQVQERAHLEQIMQSAGDELKEITQELTATNRTTRRGGSSSKPLENIKEQIARLRKLRVVETGDLTLKRDILIYCETLRDMLHHAKKLARSWKYPQTRRAATRPKSTLATPGIRETIKANLTLRSSTFRHAIRLGGTLAIATALYRIPSIPIGRGYWIVLTALLVLKPDFKTTLTRGVARTVGTLLGAAITTFIIATFRPSAGLLVLIDVLAAYLSYCLLFANYAIFSIFVTIQIVVLLTFVADPALITAEYRATDAIIGGALALLIFILWPTWERSQAPENIATRIEALKQYFKTVLQAYVYPEAYKREIIDRLHRELRLTRSNAEASIERSLEEPGYYRIDANMARGLLDAIDNIARHTITLEAYLLDEPSHMLHIRPHEHIRIAFKGFADEIQQALQLFAQAIRSGEPITEPLDLTEALHILEHAEKPDQQSSKASHIEQRLIITETRQIVRNIDIMYQIFTRTPQARSVVSASSERT